MNKKGFNLTWEGVIIALILLALLLVVFVFLAKAGIINLFSGIASMFKRMF